MSNFAAILKAKGNILCLDIGSGTQDVLLATPNNHLENWAKLVLPSPAKSLAKEIRKLSAEGKNIYLHGKNMGGGFFSALKEHLKSGLAVACSSSAAYSLYDDLERVQGLGITLSETAPAGYVSLYLSDFELETWQDILTNLNLEQADFVCVAAQDHGVHSKEIGNREGRFKLWSELIAIDNDPLAWLDFEVKKEFTRLQAIKSSGADLVVDSAYAALLGVLALDEVQDKAAQKGLTIINVGNSHTVAFLYFQGKVLGIYEHHTGLLSPQELLFELQEFRQGWISDIAVRQSGGHGVVYYADKSSLSHRAAASPLPDEAEGFMPTYIIGPRREILAGHGNFIAPFGDMMLAGCYGILYAMQNKL